jgi:hypothetical protein
MNQATPLARYAILFVSLVFLSSCGAGGDDSTSNSTSNGTGAVAESAAVTAADSSTNTITTVAGFESGLRRLAHIDDTLALVGMGDVWIDYGGSTVEGSAPGLLANCEGAGGRKNCDVYGTVTYKNPGTYHFAVSYTPSGLLADRVTLHGTAVVEAPGNFVVVSIGDSVASGEGAPMYPWVSDHEGPYWNDIASNKYFVEIPGLELDNLGCHRSTFAGPALAVNKLKQTNNVTFIHIACSGAKLHGDPVDKTTVAYRYGQIARINSQLDWVRERVPRIDVLVLSGGANNVEGEPGNPGFGSIIMRCVNPVGGLWCSEDEAFKNNLHTSIAKLPVHYAALQDDITGCSVCTDPADCPGDDLCPSGKKSPLNRDLVPSVVAITEYFDPTRDANGDFPSTATSIGCGLGFISPSEWEFLYDNMVVPLNNEVRKAATEHHWAYVEGISDAFRKHGYCASATPGDFSGASWVVKAPESLLKQKDPAGTGHPDVNGQIVYRDHIYTTLVQANPPRTVASGTTGGQPYAFGAWAAGDVEVTLRASNPIKESGVRETYYTVDEPRCNVGTVDAGACLSYSVPITITESGRHVVSFFSYNQFGAPETRAKPVEVLIDKEPPVMTCSAVPDELWPPNKRMIGITVSVTAVDEVSGPADYLLVDIKDSAGDAGNAVQGFDIGTSDTKGMMLSDRTGYGGDRFYTLAYQSQDALGNVGTCDVIVRVPHDQGKN